MPTFRITAPDGRTFRVEAPDGATRDEALARVQQQVANSDATRQRLVRQNPAEYDPSSPEFRARYGAASSMSAAQRFAAGAGKAVMDLGRGVRQIGVEALDVVTGGNRGATLRAAQDEVAARDAELLDTGAGVAGNVAGAIAATLIPGGAAARVAQGANLTRTAVATRALTNPATYRAAAAAGAAQGALQPVGTGDSRAVNTAVGAAGGTGARALVGGVSAGARAVSRAFEAPQRTAGRLVTEALERANISPSEAVRRLAELGPEARLVDLDESLAGLARATTSRPGQAAARSTARDFLEERAAGQRNRFIETTGLGDVTEFKQAMRQFMTQRHSEASALYREAYDAPLDLTTPGFTTLLERPTMKAVLRAAERNLLDEGSDLGHVRVMDAAARSLSDKVGAALRAGAKDKARRFSSMRNALLAEVDRQVPAFAQARGIYAGEAQMRDAAQLGRNLFTRRLDLDDAERMIEAMGDGERASFQRGVLRGLVDKLDAVATGKDATGQLVDSPRDREILRLAFPDKAALDRLLAGAERESTFARTRAVVKGPAAASLDGDTQLLEGAGLVGALARGDHLGVATRLMKRLGIGEVKPKTLGAVSRLLFSRVVPGSEAPSRAVTAANAVGRGARSAAVHGAAASAARAATE